MTVGGAEEKPLLGYTALEILGFKVNPISRKLEKATAIEYSHISDPHINRPGKPWSGAPDAGRRA